MTEERSYGVVPVLREGGRDLFLLVRHAAGHWSFPKGHAEAGETELETARRELAEETGIEDCRFETAAAFSETYDIPGRGVTKTVKYFLGFVGRSDVRPQEEEISECAWLEYGEALKRLTFEEARRILRAARGFLQDSA